MDKGGKIGFLTLFLFFFTLKWDKKIKLDLNKASTQNLRSPKDLKGQKYKENYTQAKIKQRQRVDLKAPGGNRLHCVQGNSWTKNGYKLLIRSDANHKSKEW